MVDSNLDAQVKAQDQTENALPAQAPVTVAEHFALQTKVKALEQEIELFYTTEKSKLKKFNSFLHQAFNHADTVAGAAWKAALAYAIAHATYVLHLF